MFYQTLYFLDPVGQDCPNFIPITREKSNINSKFGLEQICPGEKYASLDSSKSFNLFTK